MALNQHSKRRQILAHLKMNRSLRMVYSEQWRSLEQQLTIHDYPKGAILSEQGNVEPAHFFVINGLLKRSIEENGKQLILNFTKESAMEFSYDYSMPMAPSPYSVSAATKVCVARLPLTAWNDILANCSAVREAFKSEIFQVMHQTITHMCQLHLLDAKNRTRYIRRSPDLLDRLSKRDIARYLNLAPETLSRLR